MIRSILLSVLLVCCYLLTSSLSVQAKDILGPDAQCSVKSYGTGNSAVCTDNKATSGKDDPLVDTLKDITKIIAYIAGVASVILLLVGSIRYVTSDGDSNKITNAKNTIIYTLVGIVVVVLAASIIEFALNKIS